MRLADYLEYCWYLRALPWGHILYQQVKMVSTEHRVKMAWLDSHSIRVIVSFQAYLPAPSVKLISADIMLCQSQAKALCGLCRNHGTVHKEVGIPPFSSKG